MLKGTLQFEVTTSKTVVSVYSKSTEVPVDFMRVQRPKQPERLLLPISDRTVNSTIPNSRISTLPFGPLQKQVKRAAYQVPQGKHETGCEAMLWSSNHSHCLLICNKQTATVQMQRDHVQSGV
jgi:hypothetical protein